jgi:hypothetical protein
MQAAPPTSFLTNYSMLEYMLVERNRGTHLESTRQWHGEVAEENVLALRSRSAHRVLRRKRHERLPI